MKAYSKRQLHLTKMPSKSGYEHKLEYKPTPTANPNESNKHNKTKEKETSHVLRPSQQTQITVKFSRC